MPGARVTVTSPGLQGTQKDVCDANGSYRVTLLPPGLYRLEVRAEGYQPAELVEIVLRPDKTIRAPVSMTPDTVQLEEVPIRTGPPPSVNLGSAETGAVLTGEVLSSVPVGRGFDEAALLVPTATTDGLGGVAFQGAQSPENLYLVDGLDTGDPAWGNRTWTGGFWGSRGWVVSGPAALRNDFVQEIDVKTNGFQAEYGGAVGGILNVQLKGGGNEFHGSVFGTLAPAWLVQPPGATIGPSGQAIAYRNSPGHGQYGADLGTELGGPILRDRLWFYGGFSGVREADTYERWLQANVTAAGNGGNCPPGSRPDGNVFGVTGQCITSDGGYLQNEIPGTRRTLETSRTTFQWVGKLTYVVSADHSLTVSAWGAPSTYSFLNGKWDGSTLFNARSNEILHADDGQTALLVRYGGKFLDRKLIAEVQAGLFTNWWTPKDATRDGIDQFATPQLDWQEPQNVAFFEPEAAAACADVATCPVYLYSTGGYGFNGHNDGLRMSIRTSLSYLADAAGQHHARGGIDLQRTSYTADGSYSGGSVYRYQGGMFITNGGYGQIQAADGSGPLPGVELDALGPPYGANASAIISRTRGRSVAESDRLATWLQDSWSLAFLPEVTVDFGLRLEAQSMTSRNFPSTAFDTVGWDPRVAVIWDFTGIGRGKVSGSWGRFHQALPLDIALHLGSAPWLQYQMDSASCGYAAGGNPGAFDPKRLDFPVGGASAGFRPTSCILAPSPSYDVGLFGSVEYPDPGLRPSFVDMWSVTAEYEVLRDLTVGVDYLARREGDVIEDMSSNDDATVFIGNPGRDRDVYLPDGTLAGNSAGVTTRDSQTRRLVYVRFPKAERSYDGITMRVTKQLSRSWLAQASYTGSVLRGNYSGPYLPEFKQLDPGVTAEYDLASLMANKTGLLPGDQRHQVKLYGAYTWNLGALWQLGASGAYRGTSGSPVNAMGAHPFFGPGLSLLLPRGMAGHTPFVNQLDLGAALTYAMGSGRELHLRVDVFNVIGAQTATSYDENYTFDNVLPLAGSDCRRRNSAGSTNPTQALQADCPGLEYLKTLDGSPVTVNPNWGRATSHQVPTTMRLGLRVSF